MKSGLLIGLITLSLSVSAFGKEPAGLKSDKQKFSYTVGFQIGQNLKRQKLDLDNKAFSSGCAGRDVQRPTPSQSRRNAGGDSIPAKKGNGKTGGSNEKKSGSRSGFP